MQSMKLLLTFALGLILVGPVQASATNLTEAERARVEREVLAANSEMNKAAESLDVGALFDSILDEAKGPIIQDGLLFPTRGEAKAVVERGHQGVQSLTRKFQQTYVTVLSTDTALLTASGTSKVVLMDGRILEAPFAVSLVFVLRDGQWKVIQGHYSVPNR